MTAVKVLPGAAESSNASPGAMDLAYGPFDDAPLGKVIGINPLGRDEKICSFDCPYCDLGRSTVRLNKLKDESTLPTVESVLAASTELFRKIHSSGPAVDGVCISGNGEPTLHPDFADIVRGLIEARDVWLPGKPISLRTNGSALDSRKVVDAMNSIDRVLLKIDAGNEKTFKAMNAPLSRTNLARVLSGARKLKNLTVQSMFMQGAIDNVSNVDIDDWIEVIAILQPKAVHIHGISRKPAIDGLVRCEEDTLYAIASKLERRTQIKAIVVP